MSKDKIFLNNILANIEYTRHIIKENDNVNLITLITGTEIDRQRWQNRLESIAPFIFNLKKETRILSFQEETRQGNFLGTILAYSKIKKISADESISYKNKVVLIGMIFGRGERISPFSQREANCKAAISSISTVRADDGQIKTLTALEEALMYFAPLARQLEKNAFRGIVNKWGDETEIPSIDIIHFEKAGVTADTDIIKFISQEKITEESAKEKDWVIYDKNSVMLFQIPRGDIDSIEKELNKYGVTSLNDKQKIDRGAFFGISLGPVAVSYRVLDILEEVFDSDVKNNAIYIDFDPYVLSAFALKGDSVKWQEMLLKDKKLCEFAGHSGMVPDFWEKMNKVRNIFKDKYARELEIKVIDLGENIYWGDYGQHLAMRRRYLALTENSMNGAISRAIAGLPETKDARGNIIFNSQISGEVEIENSVVCNSVIMGRGRIESSLLWDSCVNDIEMDRAFCVGSFHSGKLILKKNSGAYKLFGRKSEVFNIEEYGRVSTIFTPTGRFSINAGESLNLRDRKNIYSVPVLGNLVSFSELYEMMSKVSSHEIEQWEMDFKKGLMQ
ncbi:hypothetical protein OMAG_000912 [Candidatus Omnitrophus magneticus]|uniref:Uncharacterized protein n=1 Tax=Candidatus Omnitrophus magneticus TaxID=1609969 RepID=A0A0F0CUW7_9BACT|nr:hypothetical protein OMAG_000912 [Candidatus Omnitrophus magneticus]